jgi:hypothetical protein
VNKLAENGSFASAETAFCRLVKMRATDLVLDALDRMKPPPATSAATPDRAGVSAA